MSVVVRRHILERFLLAGLQFILLLSITLPSVAMAARVSNLYEQEILVNSQEQSERQEAMGQALSNVIIKVAGERTPLGLSKVRAAIQNPATYVQAYSYRRDDQGEQRRQYLQLRFNRVSVNRLLRESGVAIWGANRPTTLMWLAVDNRSSRKILGSEATLPQIMEGHFETRGIPVIQPLLDFEDSVAISAVDVWGLFTGKLQEASRRYGAEAVLAGRLLQKGDRYSGRLVLLFRNERYQAEVSDLVAAGVASVASELVAKNLAKHYAVTVSEVSEKPLLVVGNINDVEDYAALMNYLEKLTAVREVSVYRVQGSEVELALLIDGSVTQLKDALKLGRALTAELSPVSRDESEWPLRLHYRWNQ